MPSTTNFGWTTPADTDYVKDGASAIRTLAGGIDTSMAQLKGGTTGQILSKTNGTDMAFTWINNDQGDLTAITAGTGISVTSATGPIPTVAIDTATTVDKTTAQTLTNKTISATSNTLTGVINNTLTTTTGDLIYASSANTPARLGIGSSNQVLTVSGGVPTWATPASSSAPITKITSGTFSASSNVIVASCFTSTYKRYQVIIEMNHSTNNVNGYLRVRYGGSNEQATAYYGGAAGQDYNGATTVTMNNATAVDLGKINDSSNSLINFIFSQVGTGTSVRPILTGTVYRSYVSGGLTYGVEMGSNRSNYDGFNFYPNSGTITGSYAVYGLEN